MLEKSNSVFMAVTLMCTYFHFLVDQDTVRHPCNVCKAGSQELNLSLQLVGGKSKYLGHHLLPPKVQIIRMLGEKQSWHWKSRILNQEAGVPNAAWTALPDTPHGNTTVNHTVVPSQQGCKMFDVIVTDILLNTY